MIPRPVYLEKLKTRMWNDSIKVITGIRRCGKSFLLRTIFHDYLVASGIQEKNIVMFAFDSAIDLEKIGENLIELEKNKRKVDYKKFINYISTLVSTKDKYYLLLDEVQRLDSFEYVLNGYLAMGNVDIYVTGSNSKFLSTDVITEFRGRGDEIHVMPLSFSEFFAYAGGDRNRRLDEYMTFGGLPRAVLADSEESKMNYLSSQLQNTFLKDVIERNNIKNTEELNELLSIVASGISSLTNPLKLENTFKSVKKVTLSADTISNYIQYFRESFILDKAIRYDIKGKNYIYTPFKLYFEDIGLRNARLNFRQVETTHIMENVIYNELRFRGFRVDVGMIEIRENNLRKKLEVDFIANIGNRRYYIQSAYEIQDERKKAQEIKSFNHTGDSFKKIILVEKSLKPKRDEHGYVTMGIREFLLDPNSLEM